MNVSGHPIGTQLARVRSNSAGFDPIAEIGGELWLANDLRGAVVYNAALHASIRDEFLSPHGFLKGPHPDGAFPHAGAAGTCFAYHPGLNMWLYTMGGNSLGDAENYYYYTSTDDGETWAERQFPNLNRIYKVYYVGGKFVGYAPIATTAACIYSTDGINWTSATGVNVNTVLDVVEGNDKIIVVDTANNLAVSADGAETWSAAVPGTAILNYITQRNTGGICNWSPAAGLFLLSLNANSTYATSPDGLVWTTRNTTAEWYEGPWMCAGSVQFASSPTITVAVGAFGFVMTTVDGISWSNQKLLDSSLRLPLLCEVAYWDGSRFVVIFSGLVFYSADGINWTRGKNISPRQSKTQAVTNGKLLRAGGLSGTGKVVLIGDVTLTEPAYVISTGAGAAQYNSNVVNYTRVR